MRNLLDGPMWRTMLAGGLLGLLVWGAIVSFFLMGKGL